MKTVLLAKGATGSILRVMKSLLISPTYLTYAHRACEMMEQLRLAEMTDSDGRSAAAASAEPSMILLYHHVAPLHVWVGKGPPDEGWALCHSPEGLECHLRLFFRRGYRFVPLSEMVEVIRRTGRAPDRAVAVTFDDGWKDNHEYALPILRRLGVPATFFLTTEHLRPGSRDERKMGRNQLQELVEAGMTLGGHSRTHVDLTRLPEARARDEIRGCKADLEDLTGRPVTLFAYPGGVFNRSVVDLTREAGYEAACSVLSPAPNDRSTLFWLFRDSLTERMDTLHNWYRLSPGARRLFARRVQKRLRLMLR